MTYSDAVADVVKEVRKTMEFYLALIDAIERDNDADTVEKDLRRTITELTEHTETLKRFQIYREIEAQSRGKPPMKNDPENRVKALEEKSQPVAKSRRCKANATDPSPHYRL